jgi:hypothetical protein
MNLATNGSMLDIVNQTDNEASEIDPSDIQNAPKKTNIQHDTIEYLAQADVTDNSVTMLGTNDNSGLPDDIAWDSTS